MRMATTYYGFELNLPIRVCRGHTELTPNHHSTLMSMDEKQFFIVFLFHDVVYSFVFFHQYHKPPSILFLHAWSSFFFFGLWSTTCFISNTDRFFVAISNIFIIFTNELVVDTFKLYVHPSSTLLLHTLPNFFFCRF